jgi:NADPH2:quinone reductase
MEAMAARLVEHGAPLVVEQVDIPEPGAGEVLVEMAWGSVNPVDRYGALGLVAADAPVPRTMGTEGAGTYGGRNVLVHGAGIGTKRDGLWATAAIVPVTAITEIPAGVDLEPAATIGIAGATAWRVVEIAKLTTDDRVLVLGATGGVGSMIVSLARAAGATVWGQTGNDSNRDWVTGLGADGVVVSDADELADASAELNPTVVFDSLGDGFTAGAITVIAEHGRIVLFGTSAAPTGTIPLQLLFRKSLTVFGYGGLIASPGSLAEAKAGALRAVAAGTLKVAIGATFPLTRVNEALDNISNRTVNGKMLLDLRA